MRAGLSPTHQTKSKSSAPVMATQAKLSVVFTEEYQPCIFDPFGANCGSEFETARNNRLAFCVIGENNDTPICFGAVAAHPLY